MLYQVSGVMTISVLTQVEADSEEEARSLAAERSPINLCHQCGGSRDQDLLWVTSGELDGSVTIEQVEHSD